MSQSPTALTATSLKFSLGWLLLLVGGGLLAPWLPLPFLPAVPDLLHAAEAPAWATHPTHWLGTDPQGRDVLTELLYGARQILSISLPAAILASLLGAFVGGAAGFWANDGLRLPWAGWVLGAAAVWWGLALPGGWAVPTGLLVVALLGWWLGRRAATTQRPGWTIPLDTLFQVVITLLGAVPRLVLVLVFAAGPALSAPQVVALLVLVAWPEPARQVRAQILRVRVLPFVEAARASGLPAARVWCRHALPHACRPLLATTPLSLAGLIGLETTLAFLGVGQAPDVPSWGHLLSTLPQEPGAWWVLASAGGALLLTLLALQQLARQLAARY